MTAGRIFFSGAIIAIFVVSLGFQSKCFSLLCLVSYVCLSGGVLAIFSFTEALLSALISPKSGAGEEWSSLRERQIIFKTEGAAWIDNFNASILANPWIGQMLEGDYYGLGQPKTAEPLAMLRRMEKYGFWSALLATALSLWAGWGVNPGIFLAAFALGFFIPHFDARHAIVKRQRLALMNLPAFVDLLALTVESGLDYMGSMERILASTLKKRGPLEQEVDHVLRQIQLGFPRRDALRSLSKRVDVQEMRSLVGLLIQSEELGTGLVRLLRNFSQDMRNRRVAKAEELAGKASTKMLGPLMIFIFPVIFALILSPFAMSIIKGGGLSF